jgi:ectoine hydroxylase-related dioxygenase (phytanoyl-CoA dioxygenase family)
MTATAAKDAPNSHGADLDGHYPLTREQIDSYQERGFIKLKEVLSPATLAHYEPVITSGVDKRNRQSKAMAERSTYEKAFIQIGNLWLDDPNAKEFCFSAKLARIAAELMQVRGVRMYHDQALYKEPDGGFTPWHCDQYYWPLATEKSVTAWIPFQKVPLEMGPLAFAVGSQRLELGRDLEISDESQRIMTEALATVPTDEGPFDLGEISFHAGWTFHRAGINTTKTMRKVMTVIYLDIDMRIAAPRTAGQESDLRECFPGLQPGDLADSPINPVLWSR